MHKIISSIQRLKYIDVAKVEDLKVPYQRNYPKVESTQDELISEIFAPDCFTGFPRGDLRLVLNNDTAPEIRKYVQNSLLKKIEFGVGAPDMDSCPDDNISAQFGVERDNYIKELQSVVKKIYKSNQSKETKEG